jgi:hypothetical protein
MKLKSPAIAGVAVASIVNMAIMFFFIFVVMVGSSLNQEPPHCGY